MVMYTELSQADNAHTIIKLNDAQKLQTRLLWQEVFDEDSKAFVDYYYACKIQDNTTYACMKNGNEIVAMLHLTPYQLAGGQGQYFKSYYVVGVATKPQYRHQKMMQDMLVMSMKECHDEGIPFIFLMPASPLIYEPYDFRYIYARTEYELTVPAIEAADVRPDTEIGDGETQKLQCFREILQEDYEELASVCNDILKNQADFYCVRTKAYYEQMKEELKSQNGHIIGIYDKYGSLKGELLYAHEEKLVIQEILYKQEYFLPYLKEKQEKKPIIMARITDIIGFLKLFFTIEKEIKLTFAVCDEWLTANQGVYEWHVTKDRSYPSYLAEYKPGSKEYGQIPCFHIADMTEMFFGQKKFADVKNGTFFSEIAIWQEGHINEVV